MDLVLAVGLTVIWGIYGLLSQESHRVEQIPLREALPGPNDGRRSRWPGTSPTQTHQGKRKNQGVSGPWGALSPSLGRSSAKSLPTRRKRCPVSDNRVASGQLSPQKTGSETQDNPPITDFAGYFQKFTLGNAV